MNSVGRIAVLKLGWNYYRDNVDKNSGGFEVRLIIDGLKQHTQKEVHFINEMKLPEFNMTLYDAVFVIGGRQCQSDYLNFSSVTAKKRIFIASDVDALKFNRPFINQCDLLLTQTTKIIAEYAHIEQAYSYVPELFFAHHAPKAKGLEFLDDRIDKLVFGGSIDGRKDLFEKYFANNDFCVVIHKDGKEDNRLPYHEYIEVSKQFKYTLMIVTDEARELGWITSRLFEALAYKVVPFFDKDYDVREIYYLRNYSDTLRTMDETCIEVLTQSPELRMPMVDHSLSLYCKAEENQYKFFEVVKDVL